MHCQNCGQEIIEGSDFCGNCGARIERHPVGMTCANCGSMCLPGEDLCTECGARLGGEPEPKQAFCTECGASVEQGAVFCKECGAAMNATTSPAQFVCPECGEPLSPDAVFCGNCGMSLQQGAEYDSAAPEATTAAEYQPSYPLETQNYSQQQDWAQQQIQPAAQEPLYDQQQEQNVVPQPQKSNRNKILLAAAAAVILLLVGITGFWKPGFLLDLFRSTTKLENGVLAMNDITLDFKQTNLSNGAATMTTVKDKEEEVQNGLIGDLYVMKIDKSCEGKVAVAVPVPKDFKPTTGNGRYIKLGIGRDYELEDGKTARRYSYFDAEIKDGKAVAIIDPAALGQSQFKNKANEKPAEKAPDKGGFTEYVGFFYKEGIFVYGEGYQYSKGHFRLWYDYHPTRFRKNIYMAGGDAQNLLNDLEEAYNYYKSHGYKDYVDTYTPIDVYITRQYGSGEGNEGAWDPITGNIEL
ncbi:MAG: zinc ribbon domain-containing protein, partial [Acidaminococcaceae bacterium]|nr:zinc ribbon domain-containing protein [Acidaminococcaceae bacterium]